MAKRKKENVQPIPKYATEERMQKGLKNIDRLVSLHKTNQLDYLTVCDGVRKIFNAYDFDSDGLLDKIEHKAFLENFMTQMKITDSSINQDEFRDLFK